MAKKKVNTKKQNTQKTPKTYFVVVLDKSGSMMNMQEEARRHFNEQVQTIKKKAKDQDVKVTCVLFDTEIKTKFFNEDINSLKELAAEDYIPGGGTALYDAVGLAATRLEKECKDLDDENVAVLFTVITDGHENSSKEYSLMVGGKSNLKEKIERLQNTGKWTFTFIGAGEDVWRQAEHIGFDPSNVMKVAATPKAMYASTKTSMDSLDSYFSSRTDGETQVSNYYDSDEETSQEDS